MQLTLTAVGRQSDKMLYRISVDETGKWEYESTAVEHASGHLVPGEVAQLKSLYDKVSWDREVLNNPIDLEDHTIMRLEVDHGEGKMATYQFSDAMTRLSFEFRDLVHFLRHNLATGGDPAGPVDNGSRLDQPSAWS